MFQQSGGPGVRGIVFHFGMLRASRMEPAWIGAVWAWLWIQRGENREKPQGKQQQRTSN